MNKKNTITEIKNNIFILPIISTILFTLAWSYDIKAFTYIGALLYILPALYYDFEKSIVIYYFCLPNISIFKFSNNSLALSSVFLMILFIKLVINNKLKMNIKMMLIMLAYLITSFIAYVIAQNSLSIMISEIRVIIDIIVIISIIEIFKYNLNRMFKYISTAFIYGCLVTSISGFLYALLIGIEINGFRLEAVNSDPNYFSLCLAFCISLILVNIYNNNNSKTDILFICLFTMFGLMSLSRGFLVSMLINVLFFIYIYLFTNRMTFRQKIIIILVILFVAIIMNDIIYNIVFNYKDRIFGEETSGGSGRIEIWITYLKLTFSNIGNMFFGLGISSNELLKGFVHHNLYIEILSGKGIIGTIVIISIYRNIYINMKYKLDILKLRFISFIPIMTLGLGFMFLNGITADIGIMSIFLGIFSLNIFNNKLEV